MHIETQTPLRVLIVEDSESDMLLLLHVLRQGGYEPAYERVDTAEAMRAALAVGGWEIVLSEYSMPHFDGFEALRLVRQSDPDLPFIIVSGTIGEDRAVSAMKAGAHDYVMKSSLTRLAPAVERELREAKERRVRKQAEAQVRMLSQAVMQSASLIFICTLAGDIVYINDAFTRVTGYTPQEILGQHISVIQGRDGSWDELEALYPAFSRESRWSGVLMSKKKNGASFWVFATASGVETDSGVHILFTQEDITVSKQAQDSLKRYAKRLEVLHVISQSVLQGRSAEKVAVAALQGLESLIVYERAGFVVIENDTQAVRVLAMHPAFSQPLLLPTLDVFEKFAPDIVERLKQGKQVVIDLDHYAKQMPFLAEYIDTQRGFVLLAPAIEQGRWTGALFIVGEKVSSVEQETSSVLREVANSLAVAIEQIRLRAEVARHTEKLEALVETRTMELRRIKEQVETILYNSSDLIILTDSEGTILRLNPTFERFFNHLPDSFIGQPITALIEPQYAAQFAAAMSHARAGAQGLQLEVVASIGAGAPTVEVEIGISAILEPDGSIPGFVYNLRDITRRKQAEAALRVSQERYDLATRNGKVGVWEVNFDTRQMYISPSLKGNLGYSDHEVPNTLDAWSALSHPNDTAIIQNAAQAYINGQAPAFECERRMVHKDGSLRWVLTRGVAIPNADGQLESMIGTDTDITEIKQYQAVLQRQEALFKAVSFTAEKLLRAVHWQDSIAEIMASLGRAANASSVYIFENSTTHDGSVCFNHRGMWLAESNAVTLSHPEKQGVSYAAFGLSRWAELLANRQIVTGPLSNFPAHERTALAFMAPQSLLVVPVFVNDLWWGFMGLNAADEGRVWTASEIEAMRVAADALGAIIRRQKIEQELSRSEQLYRLLAENASDVIWTMDASNRIAYISPSAVSMLGLTPEECLGRSIYEWLSPASAQVFREAISPQILSDADGPQFCASTIELELRRRDGQMIWAEVSLSPLYSTVGEYIGFLGAARDITRRRALEAVLRESELYHRTVAELVSDFAYSLRVEPDGALVPEWMTAPLGSSIDSSRFQGILTSIWQKAVYADDSDQIAEHFQTVLAGVSHTSEFRVYDQSGDLRWIRNYARPVWDFDQSQVIRIIGAAQDVTHQRQAAEMVRASELKFRQFIAQSRDGIALTNELGIVVEWNRAMEHITGLGAAEMIGQPINAVITQIIAPSVINPSDNTSAEAFAPNMSDFLSGELVRWSNRLIEREVVDSDGSRRFLQSVVFPIETDNGYMGGIISRDITERKLLEKKLQESEKHHREVRERVEAILNNTDDGILLVRPNGMVQQVNPAFNRAFGFSADEAFNVELAALVADAEKMKAAVEAVNRARQPIRFETSAYDRSGNLFYVDVILAPIISPGHQVGGLVCSMRNITERKHLEEQLRRSHSELEQRVQERTAELTASHHKLQQAHTALAALLRERERYQSQLIQTEKMTALGRLVASIAHEINNPIQAVQGCLTLVQEERSAQNRPEKINRYLHVIEEEIERIANIVRRMRDFYRPATDQMSLIDVQTVLESVLALMSKQLQHSNISVKCEWAPELPKVLANPDHLKQVFLNLILNAEDAMPGGGPLTIRTAQDYLQPVDPDFAETSLKAAVRIDIQDAGKGIPKEILTHLFEPFVTTKANGTGLGLMISYGIIQRHKGRIVVDSRENIGTTFSILLPVNDLSNL